MANRSVSPVVVEVQRLLDQCDEIDKMPPGQAEIAIAKLSREIDAVGEKVGDMEVKYALQECGAYVPGYAEAERRKSRRLPEALKKGKK